MCRVFTQQMARIRAPKSSLLSHSAYAGVKKQEQSLQMRSGFTTVRNKQAFITACKPCPKLFGTLSLIFAATFQSSAIIFILEISKWNWEKSIALLEMAEPGVTLLHKLPLFPSVLVLRPQWQKEARTFTSNCLVREKEQVCFWHCDPDLVFRGAIESDKPLLSMLILWEEYPRLISGGRGKSG